MWAARGYDFVRSTALVGGAQSSADAFNQALAEAASRMPWTLAPMHWDGGRASQDLFLFQPARTGLTPVDLEKIRQAREQRQIQRDARRIQLQDKKKG